MSQSPFTTVPPHLMPTGDLPQRAQGAAGNSCEFREAMEFIALCNHFQGAHPVMIRDQGETTARIEIHDQELPPKQEAAFAQACNYVGCYFTDALQRNFGPPNQPSNE